MGDTTGFRLVRDRSTLTQVNSFSRHFWQPAGATAMKPDYMRVQYDRDELPREHLRADPCKQLAAWAHGACESGLMSNPDTSKAQN